MAPTVLGDRVVVSGRTTRLVAGDAIAVGLFAVLGELRHAGTVRATVETFGEFGLAWVLVATAVGAYGPRALDSPARAAALAVVAWVGAAVVGAAIRAAIEPGATLAPVFVLVTAAVGGILLAVWRFAAARWILATR